MPWSLSRTRALAVSTLLALAVCFESSTGLPYEQLVLRGGGNIPSKIVQAESRTIRRLIMLGGTADGRLAMKTGESLVLDPPMNKDGTRAAVVREWTPHSAMLDARDSGAAVSVDLQVYAIGGYNGDSELTSVEMCAVDPYERTNSSWEYAPSLRKRRCNLGAAVSAAGSKRTIFAVGGYNGTHDLPNAEFLRVSDRGLPEGVWEWGPTMAHRRSGPAVTSLGEKIYAAGGFDGVGLLSTVEEMSGDQWVQVAPMPLGVRGGCAGVSVAGRIYVIGGASGEARLPRMESMDPREGRWVKEASMNVPRAGVAAVAVEDRMQIVAAGGFDGSNVLSSVELFDVKMRGAWILEPYLSSKRWGASMVSVRGKR